MFDIQTLNDLANSEAVFALLFIAILWLIILYVKNTLTSQKQEETEREQYIMEMHKQREDDYKQMLKEQREESTAREVRLMDSLDSLTEQQAEISETLKDVRNSLGTLEGKMERNFTEVWKEMSRIQKKGDE